MFAWNHQANQATASTSEYSDLSAILEQTVQDWRVNISKPETKNNNKTYPKERLTGG